MQHCATDFAIGKAGREGPLPTIRPGTGSGTGNI